MLTVLLKGFIVDQKSQLSVQKVFYIYHKLCFPYFNDYLFMNAHEYQKQQNHKQNHMTQNNESVFFLFSFTDRYFKHTTANDLLLSLV